MDDFQFSGTWGFGEWRVWVCLYSDLISFISIRRFAMGEVKGDCFSDRSDSSLRIVRQIVSQWAGIYYKIMYNPKWFKEQKRNQRVQICSLRRTIFFYFFGLMNSLKINFVPVFKSEKFMLKLF